MSDERPPFERTVCTCEKCVECCSRPAHLIPSDIKRIADFLAEKSRVDAPADATIFFRASSGTSISIRDRRRNTIHTTMIPTITPRTGPNGRCVFLDDANRCTIHDVAPFGCAFFDMHMPKEEADKRSWWGVREIAPSEQYKALRAMLAARDERRA
jgi:Fe-S-cluster containining protein